LSFKDQFVLVGKYNTFIFKKLVCQWNFRKNYCLFWEQNERHK